MCKGENCHTKIIQFQRKIALKDLNYIPFRCLLSASGFILFNKF